MSYFSTDMYDWEFVGPVGDRQLKDRILILLDETPGLDDVKLADRLQETPFKISLMIGELKQEGLIVNIE